MEKTHSNPTQKIESKDHLQIFQEIVEKRRQQPEGAPTMEGINDLLQGLPKTVAKSLSAEIPRLKSLAKDDEAFRELFMGEAKRAESQYAVERFKMSSKLFAKEEVKHFIDELLSNTPTLDDLKKVARISIDANGLKAVNDLNRGDHSKGDVFLETIARVVKDEQMVEHFTKQGITLIPTSDGGDEFGIVVMAEHPITEEILNGIMRSVNENLLSEKVSQEVKNVLDFKNESVISAFAGFSSEEWNAMSRDEKDEEIKKLAIPEDFTFQARASMGATTLHKSFLTMSGEKHEIHKGDSYDRVLEKLMGGVFSQSDENMQENKDKFKKGLRESEDPKEKFLSLVYSRTEAERELSKELTETKEKLEDCLSSK